MLGKRIKVLRRKLKLSKSKIAKLLNKDKETIASWEKNELIPSDEELIKLSKIFNCSVEDLLNDNDSITEINEVNKKSSRKTTINIII